MSSSCEPTQGRSGGGQFEETCRSCLEWGQEGERHCRRGRIREGIMCFEKALEVGTEDVAVLSAIYCQLGCTHFNANQLDAALKYHTLDMELEKTIGDKKCLSRAYGNIGNVYKKMGNFELAIQNTQQQLEIARETEDKECIARALFNLGSSYWLKGRYTKKMLASPLALPGISSAMDEATEKLRTAAMYFEEAVEILEELLPEQTGELDRVCGSLGNVYYLLGEYDTAAKHHHRRLDLARQRADKAAQLRAYLNLGNTHVFMHDIDRAFEYYRIAITLAMEIGDRATEGQACYHMANTALLIEDYRTAYEYFIRHLRIARETGDKFGEAKTCQFLSIVFNRQEEPMKATYWLGVTRQIGKELNEAKLVETAEEAMRRLVRTNENLVKEDQELRMDSSADPEPRKIRLSLSMSSLGSPGFPTASLRMAFSEINLDVLPVQETPKAIPRGDVGLRSTFHQDDLFEEIFYAQSRRMDDQRCEAPKQVLHEIRPGEAGRNTIGGQRQSSAHWHSTSALNQSKNGGDSLSISTNSSSARPRNQSLMRYMKGKMSTTLKNPIFKHPSSSGNKHNKNPPPPPPSAGPSGSGTSG